MKIYLLLAHPDSDSLNGKIAETYFKKALEYGHQVRFQRLGEMNFDPILWKGYKVIQKIEPDLKAAQENILWCEHWVIVYPVWWGNMPALLKGFFDRILLPGFAFQNHKNDPLWDKLLKGRSAHIITTSDAQNSYIRLQYRNSDINAVKRATFEFCGIESVKVTRIDNILYKNEEDFKKVFKKVASSVIKSGNQHF